MSAVTVAPFTGEAREWDAFVRSQPGWTPFHLHAWRDVLREVHGHELLLLAARDASGALAGVLPLARVRTPLFGHFLVSMPFVSYGGPLGTPGAEAALADAAAAGARAERAALLELRSRRELATGLAVSHRKVTVLLDIPAGGSPALWAALPSKLRSQVRRPQKEGVEVRFGPDQVEPFFEVFARHMRDLGTPTQPRRFFERIRDAFGDTAWFGCAWLDGVPVAAGAGFRWAEEFEITWASSLREHNRVAPNMLLYWAFMERAADDGARVFNFGRCTPGAGTHRFKHQWGSRDEVLWWYQLARDARAGTPSPDDSAYAWGPRLWKRLPVPVATALGPHIVRGIP